MMLIRNRIHQRVFVGFAEMLPEPGGREPGSRSETTARLVSKIPSRIYGSLYESFFASAFDYQFHGTAALGRFIRGLIDLHDHLGVLGPNQRLLAQRHALQEMQRLLLHRARIYMVDRLARHRGNGELDALLHG